MIFTTIESRIARALERIKMKQDMLKMFEKYKDKDTISHQMYLEAWRDITKNIFDEEDYILSLIDEATESDLVNLLQRQK
jgi:hypothetical protein